MLCPTDQTVLVMTERKGVEIDYCPTCRGVWLDRGELDKIIDRSASYAGAGGDRDAYIGTTPEVGGMAGRIQRLAGEHKRDYDDDDDRYEQRYDDKGRPVRKKKRGSFLEDLFDFD